MAIADDLRNRVCASLGSDWHVRIEAIADEVPTDKSGYVSALVVAERDDGVEARITFHRSVGSVLIRLGSLAPVPFEDLAVAKRALKLQDLLDRAAVEPQDLVEPAIDVWTALRWLSDWGPCLATDLDPGNPRMANPLREIAEAVMRVAGFFEYSPPPATLSQGREGGA